MTNTSILTTYKNACRMRNTAGCATILMVLSENLFQTHTMLALFLIAYILSSFFNPISYKALDLIFKGVDSRDRQIKHLKQMVVGE